MSNIVKFVTPEDYFILKFVSKEMATHVPRTLQQIVSEATTRRGRSRHSHTAIHQMLELHLWKDDTSPASRKLICNKCGHIQPGTEFTDKHRSKPMLKDRRCIACKLPNWIRSFQPFWLDKKQHFACAVCRQIKLVREKYAGKSWSVLIRNEGWFNNRAPIGCDTLCKTCGDLFSTIEVDPDDDYAELAWKYKL